MNFFVLNVLLAILWMAINSNFSPASLVVGFLIGYLVVGFAQPLFGGSGYMARLWYAVYFALFFLGELFRSSFRVAADVLRPKLRQNISPAIVAVPLDVEGDFSVTLLANVISLTPGTLTLDVSDDKRVLYIHSMYGGDDPDAVRREIKSGLERRVLEVTR
ncbi:Na+/H+ antiporter subunit E [Truepera radiovictrix]|uniref:Cation antiporter n=1 Tax=Truepera radiovictrix (strain DSM 17093 / CIP 108686 / LMG 22925 / RQ-24) TaxID=649638 RepID=D7CUJ5_TRURR|nr:Na+/H+ antiporter subunit E [Truepera radiovictrix]ADI15780.1 cation antiporter [Truepera radiovictrix DSM 17093]WMT58593.1 Na+/H+ antiporter subunit E [Truepera radiovictrix]